MIRIELFNKNGHLVKSFDFSGDEFKIGRSVDCDLIIPSFSFQPIELVVAKTGINKYAYQMNSQRIEISQTHVLKIHGYKIVFSNLLFYSNQNSSAGVKLQREWIYPLAVFFVLLLIHCFRTLFTSTKPYLSDQDFTFILAIGIINLALSFGLVLVSKIINHEYNFWKILSTLFNMSLLISVIATFGLRWLPYRLFENDLLWISFLLILVFPFFWKLTFIVCEHFEHKIKTILAFIPFVIFILFAIISTFPFQKHYKYVSYQPRPAVFEFLETKKISVEELVQKIDSEIE